MEMETDIKKDNIDFTCTKDHNTEETVCKECYMELLEKYNKLLNKTKNSSIKKSQWQTW
jgi:hypothetical protein